MVASKSQESKLLHIRRHLCAVVFPNHPSVLIIQIPARVRRQTHREHDIIQEEDFVKFVPFDGEERYLEEAELLCS